jgi:hypothetical protein
MILYVFAVAATELIGRHKDYEDDVVAQELFGNLMRSLFTMFQLMTLDTYCDTVVRPMMQKQPWLALFFIFFVMLAVFVFWNLITAIIVDTAFCIAKEDSAQLAKEAETDKRRDLKALTGLFLELDKDESGELSKDEFRLGLLNPKVKLQLDLLEMTTGDLEDVWNVLDDGDGLLTIKEFTNGLRRMKGEAKAKDIIDCCKRLRHAASGCHELKREVRDYNNILTSLESDVRRIAEDTGEVLGLLHEMYHRLDGYTEEESRKDRAREHQRKVEASKFKHEAEEEVGQEKLDDA